MDNKLVKDDILKECLNLCELNNSELVFCCESGSRSWGYSSETSDYDVRGIYIKKRSEYVYSLFGKENDKGVLEIEITKNEETKNEKKYDIVLWDIKKVINLYFKNGNQMPIWWLTSDIVYFDSELALTVKQFFMQKNNTILDKIAAHCYGLIMQKISQPVTFKNYIYIWRAVLFADYTIKTNKTPDTQNIINLSQNATEEVKIIINELINCFKNKNNFKEEEYKPNLDLLNTYIKNIKTFITENKTSKFIFDKDWEILINNIWMN